MQILRKIKVCLLLSALSLLALPALLSSCIYDDEVVPEVKGDEYVVSLRISAGSETTYETNNTRSVVESDEDGVGMENYIDVNSIRIFFYTGSNAANTVNASCFTLNYMQEFVPEVAAKMGNGEYLVQGALSQAPPTGAFKVAVVANTKNCTTINPTADKTCFYWTVTDGIYYYNYGDGVEPYKPSEDIPIPMYGIKTYSTGATFKAGESTDLGTITMIRAMAKVEITSDKNVITNVRLASCYDRGFTTPAYMYANSSVPADYEINIPNFVTNLSTGTPINLSNVKFDHDGNNYWIYMPEYVNNNSLVRSNSLSAANKVPTYMIVTVRDTETQEEADFEVDFKNYDTDVLFNILRNHIYRYKIAVVNARLTLKYEVEPWDEKTAGDIYFE